jgi:hypothetical protein
MKINTKDTIVQIFSFICELSKNDTDITTINNFLEDYQFSSSKIECFKEMYQVRL